MNTLVKALLALVVLAAAGWLAWNMTNAPTEGPGPVAIDESPKPIERDQTPDPTNVVDVAPTTRQDPAVDRTEVRADANTSKHYAQGIRGRAVDDLGVPVANAAVSLRTIAPGGIFAAALRQQQGLGNAPISTATTDETGAFDLGVAKATEGPLELWFTSERTIDQNLPNMAVEAGAWRDIGAITLKRGAMLYGRVTDERTGAPIPGALVLAKNPMIGGLSPAPGREEGVPAITDANGDYRLENLQQGVLMMSAAATGYATITSHDVRLTMEAPAEANFALPIGLGIEGFVTDVEGNGIAGAMISAVCLSTKTPMKVDVRCDSTGRFEIQGLVDAPFQLNAQAPGFLRATMQPVQAGETAQVVLEKQGGARIRVLAPNGRAIKTYHVAMLRHFSQNNTFGFAHDVPQRDVQARDLDAEGAFEITGLNPASYAVEIYCNGYAKTRSEPFEVAVGQPTPLVTVTMKNGGRIVGKVVGPDGNPMRNVEIETTPPNMIEVPFIRDLQHLMATDVTRQKQNSKADGSYEFTNLSAGTYQLKFSHPDTYVSYVRDVVVADEQTTEAETARLQPGTRVFGIVRVDGQPAVGVKVSISSQPPMGQPGTPGAGAVPLGSQFSDETVTNERGEYQFPRRVPPGSYSLRAGRQTANPLEVMLDFKKTEQQVNLQNQDSFEFSPNIASS